MAAKLGQAVLWVMAIAVAEAEQDTQMAALAAGRHTAATAKTVATIIGIVQVQPLATMSVEQVARAETQFNFRTHRGSALAE
jgi:hypothetical protein